MGVRIKGQNSREILSLIATLLILGTSLSLALLGNGGVALAKPPPSPYYVYGFVVLKNGTHISGAQVYVNDTTANTSQSTVTDSLGEYQVSSLTNSTNGDLVTVTANYFGAHGTNNTTVNTKYPGSWCNVTLLAQNLTVALSVTPTPAYVSQNVTLTATTRGGLPPYSYLWNFGDGSPLLTTSINTTVHAYASAGTFPANVTVTAAGNTSANATSPVTVLAIPSLTMVWSPPAPKAGQTVNFTAVLSPAGAGWRYFFTYGDGNNSGLTAPGTNVAGHAYQRPGTYSFNVTAFNATSNYRVDSPIYSLTVSVGFTISLLPNPSPSEVGANTSFTATVTGSSTALQYLFSFGDTTSLGPTSSATVQHVYTASGNYTVNVTGTNATGISASTSLVLPVVPSVTVALAASKVSGNAPLTTELVATAKGGFSPYSYLFKLGSTVLKVQPGNTFNDTLSAAGSYTFSVVVTDFYNVTATSSVVVKVTQAPPPPTLVATLTGPSNGSAGTPLSFTVSATGGVPAYKYTWDFGDGTLVANGLANESHTWTSAGTYTISVWVNDSAGASYKVTHTVTITTSAPQPTNVIGSYLWLILLVLLLLIVLLVLLVAIRRRKKGEPEEAMSAPAPSGPTGPSGVPPSELEAGVAAVAVGSAVAEAPAEPQPPAAEPAAAPEEPVSSPPVEPETSPEPSTSEPSAPEAAPEAPPSSEPSVADPAPASPPPEKLSKRELRKRRRMERQARYAAAAGAVSGMTTEAAPDGTPSSENSGGEGNSDDSSSGNASESSDASSGDTPPSEEQ